MVSNVAVDRTIRSALREEFNFDLDIHSEYPEVSPLSEEDYPALKDWLSRKYGHEKFDVVVTVGGSMFRFVCAYYHDLFSEAKIVFWGRPEDLEISAASPPVTGVVAPRIDDQINAILEFIRNLQPDLERLVVVRGASSADQKYKGLAEQTLRENVNGVAVTQLRGPSVETLSAWLKDLPPKSAILFLSMTQDGAGKEVVKSEVLSKLTPIAAAPVYSPSILHLDTGIVGGAMADQESMSRDAADLVVRLLRGEPITNLPIRYSPIVPMVDWRQLKRWRIPENRLPPGTVVRFSQPSLWDVYRWHIIAGLALCALQTGLIVGLLIHRARRRKAERALKENRQILQSTIDALDAHVALLDETGKIIAVNQPWTRFADANGYAGSDRGLGKNYLEVCKSSIECEEARLVLTGIRRLMSGESDDFRCVYPCHSAQEGWFQVRINRFHTDGVLRLVVAHENVTEIKQAQNAQQQLTGVLLRAQDEERRRIAHNLHDVTVQNMASIKADLTRAQTIDDLRAILTVKESLSLCDQVITELRSLSYLLHPPLLDEVGLIPALQWFIRGFMQHSGIQVKIVVMRPIGRLESNVETALFRVVQESLTNVHRHSGSPTALIWVTKQRDEVMLRITDKGQGISEPWLATGQESMISSGVGIMGMRQRLKQLGGRLEIQSSTKGTTVTARISLTGERHAAHSNC